MESKMREVGQSVCLGYKSSTSNLADKKNEKAIQRSLKDDASHNFFSPALGLRSRIIAAKVYPTPQGTLEENVKISFNGRDKVRSNFKETKIKMCCLYSGLIS